MSRVTGFSPGLLSDAPRAEHEAAAFGAGRPRGLARAAEPAVQFGSRRAAGDESRLEDSGVPASAHPRCPHAPDALTERELEVLRLVAEGYTDAQMAERLVISIRTVQAHLRSIYSKLGVATRSAATCYAFQHQMV